MYAGVQLAQPGEKNLFRQPGLVCNHEMKYSKPAVVQTPEPIAEEVVVKKKMGRPRKTESTEAASSVSEPSVKPKKKLDVSKAKVY
jgi:hypothetical protein